MPDLARYGVRYVIIHESGVARPDYIPKPGTRIPGLRYIGGDSVAALYRVTAAPSKFTTYAASASTLPRESLPAPFAGCGTTARSCMSWAPAIRARATFPSSRAASRAPESSPSGTRRIALSTATGSGRSAKVRFPLRFSNRTDLSFSTDPPPEQVNLVIGGEDTRSFGVFIGRVRFQA